MAERWEGAKQSYRQYAVGAAILSYKKKMYTALYFVEDNMTRFHTVGVLQIKSRVRSDVATTVNESCLALFSSFP